MRRAAVLISAVLLLGCAQLRLSNDDCTSYVANAFYAGPYRGADNNLSPADFARDYFCADLLRKRRYPGGFVGIYGSSRIGETNKSGDEQTNAANNRIYAEIRAFARKWTSAYGARFPVLTGAGPGLMEAGSRGATEAGGPSIGFTTYYGPSREKGDARLAFHTYKESQIISDGIIFSSVAVREYAMIVQSSAVIIGPGGSGTEWELFQILETLKSQQLNPVPVYLLGERKAHWASLELRLADMVRRGTVREREVTDLFVFVESASELFALLERHFRLK